MWSYVDPITNTAVISQVDLRRDIGRFLQLDFPEGLLPTFLHEGTHHACFLSPVGTTLALLRMRAYRRATSLRGGETSEDEWDLLEDVLRQEATMEVLRPISEGLACFAELDSIPGESNVLTAPMSSAFFHFGGGEHEFKSRTSVAQHGPGLFLFALLHRMRLDDELCRRRERILTARFSSIFGGHLAGYMGLKTIWMRARRTSDLAWDAELFSAYVRSYLFDDYGLVSTILDPGKSEHNAANEIANYVLRRLNQLLTMDWEPALEEYARTKDVTVLHAGLTGQRMHPTPGGLNNDRQLHDLGLSRLEGLMEEIDSSDRSHELDWLMRQFDLQRLQKRQLLCLASLEAKVVVNALGRVIAYPMEGASAAELPFLGSEAQAGVKPGEGAGSVEFYLIPAEHSRAFAVIRKGEVVHVHFEGSIKEPRRRELTRLFGTRSKDLRILQEQEQNLEKVIADSAIRYVRTQARSTIPEGVDQLYSVLVTIDAPHDRHMRTSQTILAEGLLGLCDGDEEFLHGLAFLGVASSVSSGKAELRELARDSGVDLDAVCRKAGSIKEVSGLALLLNKNDQILVVI